jgi:hypothetical protein
MVKGESTNGPKLRIRYTGFKRPPTTRNVEEACAGLVLA